MGGVGKKIIISTLATITIFLGYYFKDYYIEYINTQIRNRQDLYEAEKVIAVYSALNEIPLISENFLSNEFLKTNFLLEYEDYAEIRDYINNLYPNYKGILKVVDPITANNEYNKRLLLLEKIEDKYNIFGQIQFTPLLNIKKLN